MRKVRTNKKSLKGDVSDTFGIRGAGPTWKADFGEPLNEQDLLFSVRREPIAYRTVITVAHDIFDKSFEVQEVSGKPNHFSASCLSARRNVSPQTLTHKTV